MTQPFASRSSRLPHLRHLSRLAAAACLLGTMPLAWSAADPVAGGTRYTNSCATCHGAAASPSNPAVLRGRNAPNVIRNAIAANRGGMGFLSGLSDAELANVAAFLGNSPSSLSFTATTVGQSSAAQSVTVRASSSLALNSLSAATSGDFQRSGGSCGSSLAAGASCTIDLQFVPSTGGSRTGSLTLTHNGISDGVAIALSGTGNVVTAPVLAVNGSSLGFGDQVLSTNSATQTLTVTNSGNAALNFSSIALAGAAAADYQLSGNCAVGTAVTAGAQCSIGVVFSPKATGARSATLNLASDGGSASVQLSGNGTVQAAPAASFSAAQIAFGNQTVGTTSAPQSLTLTNSGNADLSITGLQASLPFGLGNNTCGNTLAAKASCTVQLSFTPTGTGPATGSLSLTSNASGSPHSVALTGSGVPVAPQLAWTPAASALNFGSGTVGAALASQTLTLANQGPGSASITELHLAGSNAADFMIDGSSSCQAGGSLDAGSSCSVVVGFVPGGAGARNASLSVVSDGNAPGNIALAGTGVAAPAPVLSLSSQALSFVRTPSATSGPSQVLTIANSGNADLQVTALTLAPAGFALAAGGNNACAAAPFTLTAGAQCELTISWNSSTGTEQGSLTVASNATGSPATVTLSAGSQSATPVNSGSGGCTIGEGTTARDPSLVAMAFGAVLLLWRRRRRAQPRQATREVHQ